jgi:hypothetical protein
MRGVSHFTYEVSIMSNKLQRRRNREVAAVRNITSETHQRPSVNHASGVTITRSKTLDWKNVAYEVRGEKKFGKVLVRPVTVEVRSSTRRVEARNGVEVHTCSGIGSRPEYVWQKGG